MSRFLLLLASLSVFASGCASQFMSAQGIPGPGDSTQVGNVKVKVVDLDAARSQLVPVVRPSIPKALIDGSHPSYVVGPFDVLIVTVWEHPELTQPLGQYRSDLAAGQLVDADGYMFFPYAGRLKIAGLNLKQSQELVTSHLAKILKNPQVDIKVSAFRSQRVYVSGQVRQPGVVTIDDVPMHLPELLNRVGGILPAGDASGVQLVRAGKIYELDIEGLQQIGAPLDSIRIHPGDQLRVPGTDDRVAYILGEVERPAVLPLANGRMSLIRGLTQAGGYDALSADAAGVYVVRAHDSSRVTVFRLDGRSPVALAWAGQFQLRPRDLVYVDQSGLSRWSKVFQMLVPISSVLSNATGMMSNTTGTAVNLQNIKETWVGP